MKAYDNKTALLKCVLKSIMDSPPPGGLNNYVLYIFYIYIYNFPVSPPILNGMAQIDTWVSHLQFLDDGTCEHLLTLHINIAIK